MRIAAALLLSAVLVSAPGCGDSTGCSDPDVITFEVGPATQATLQTIANYRAEGWACEIVEETPNFDVYECTRCR